MKIIKIKMCFALAEIAISVADRKIRAERKWISRAERIINRINQLNKELEEKTYEQ